MISSFHVTAVFLAKKLFRNVNRIRGNQAKDAMAAITI